MFSYISVCQAMQYNAYLMIYTRIYVWILQYIINTILPKQQAKQVQEHNFAEYEYEHE